MSTFKHSEGKLVEQPTMEKPNGDYGWTPDAWLSANKQYNDHLASLRTYIAEGFDEDELAEEKDLEFVYQFLLIPDANHKWSDCNRDAYELTDAKYRRIIVRRKVTKEEGEKPDEYQIACEDVLKEVRRAKTMFKEKFVNQHEGYAVILEELDELWDEIKKNQRDYVLSLQRKEAIQCAAMCIRFIAELTPNNLT